MPDKDRRAFLLGDWDSFVGQFFSTWDRAINVCDPFEIPASWPRWRAIDYGGTAPFCCLWLAADPAQSPLRVYVYREHYAAGQTLKWHCERILDLSRGEVYRGTVADPSMFAKTQEEAAHRVSLADQAKRHGLLLTPASNARVPGAQLVKQALLPRSDGVPGLVIFGPTCPNLVRTLPTLCHDSRVVEDVDTGQEDHGYDATRYGLSAILGHGTRLRAVTGGNREAVVAASAYSAL